MAKKTSRKKARKSVRKPKKPSTMALVKASVKGAAAKALAKVTRPADAITLLEADHRRLEDLLKQGEQTTERGVKQRRELLSTIAAELTVHELIEERVLYPALKEHPETRDIVLEGFQEHHVADLVMKELHDTAPSDEEWGAKFKVFKENIEHHIGEEEGPMFRGARGVLTAAELAALGTTMARMKAELTRGESRRRRG